jgi:DNA-directed RNA polymerase subunit alpha
MSKQIHTPTLSNVDDHSTTSATFVVEPLHTGYGMTLGNSIRRVLLSSIAGAAITAFKVEGATHEFTAVKGVKEDVVDIMLNLKSIRFRVYSDEPQTLRIVKKGKGVVTAKDIQVNADVEIVNPSDMIAIDAIFSPVLRVRYKVESTRVGQTTNLDKLLLTVETDGSITPRDAFEEANAILVNQYTALAGQTRVEAPAPLIDSSAKGGEDADVAPALMTPIEDLNLSARTTNALINNEIHTLKDLFSLGDAELRDLKGFGSKALDEVKEKMAELEL